MSLWHAFQQLPAPVQTGVMIEVGILIFALGLLGWSLWSRAGKVGKKEWWAGYNAAKRVAQEAHSQMQKADTQVNVYGRIKNALEPHDRRAGDQNRGVKIIPLGNHGKQDVYTINLFWFNNKNGLGILGIDIHLHTISVTSFAGWPCGEKRKYTVGINETGIVEVIQDVKKFIDETYEMAAKSAAAQELR